MEKRRKIIIISVIGILSLLLLLVGYHYYRLLTAKIVVIVKPNKTLEIYDEVHISDMITSINGKLLKDDLIDTSTLGKKEVLFDYINDDKIRVTYSFEVKVVDKTPPIIGVTSPFTVVKGDNLDLSKEFFCGDNYDNTPSCVVEGTYDINTPGSYNLIFKATDKSKNVNSANFVLNVIEKSNDKSVPSNVEPKSLNLEDVIANYKTKKTKIGIDVSKWQGNINYEQVKKAGVEFVIIRVGSEDKDGNFYVDNTFEQNIKGFNKVGIPVGIYYFSYADSINKAKKEAKWVIKQIKKYDVDLPVVFDWENWGNYQDYKLSFHKLTEVAEAFLDTIENAGYKGMLYSSKYYLENIWYKTDYKVWLAHYTNQTNYQGDYYLWQLCSNGKVAGINDNLVDIDVMYK